MHPYRQNHLELDRQNQRKREGVKVTYKNGFRGYALYFHQGDLQRISILINQDFKIEISTLESSILQTFTVQDCKIDDYANCILFGNSNICKKLRENWCYFLTKCNSSNANHRDLYKPDTFAKDSLATFVDDFAKGKIRDIKCNEILQFRHQEDLNPSQNKALAMMARNALTFVKGPPGTGKTRLIARACILFQARQMKSVVGTVSNTAMASIMRELGKQANKINDEKLVLQYMDEYRKGNESYLTKYAENHEDRLKLIYYNPMENTANNRRQPDGIQYYMIKQHMLRAILKNQAKKKLHDSAKRYTVVEIQTYLDQVCVKVMKEMVPSDFKEDYRQAFIEVISAAGIIIATTVVAKNINKFIFGKNGFKPDVCIIDEAGQAKIQDVFCPLYLNPNRLILVGDDKQLGPIIIGFDKVLEETLFDCCQSNKNYFLMLDIQYRMHPKISKFSNNQFYQGKIFDDISTKQLTSQHPLFRDYPCIFIDHNQPEKMFLDRNKRNNYVNELEVEIIKNLISTFPKNYLQKIGIITLYLSQVELLNKVLCEEVKLGLMINTCDAFQGGEKDYIIVSCVRANENGDIGFCGDRRRVNVTMTRAKKGLAVVGSLRTMAQNFKHPTEVWAIFADFMKNEECVKSYDEILAGPWLCQDFAQYPLKRFPKERANKYEHIAKEIKDNQGDEVESLLAKNKEAKKSLTRMSIFFQSQPGSSPLNIDEQLEKILTIFSTIPSVKQICLCMTPEIFKTFLNQLENQSSVNFFKSELRKLISSRISENNRRIYSNKLVYDILLCAIIVTALINAGLC